MAVSETEIQLQQELGIRVYTEAERLRQLALARIGIQDMALQPGAGYDVTFSVRGRWKVNVQTKYQLHANEDVTRLVEVQDAQKGLDTGRFVQPDGGMWVLADSSQGEPWLESPWPVGTLAEVIDCLYIPAEANCDVNAAFAAFKPHNYPVPGVVS